MGMMIDNSQTAWSVISVALLYFGFKKAWYSFIIENIYAQRRDNMKKLCLSLIVMFAIFLICCKTEPQSHPGESHPGEYSVGDIGPTGGYIFYDCDADNDSGNADGLISTEVGWRYLEAAPADLRLVDCVPTVDPIVTDYSSASYRYIFGYYRKSDSGSNLYVNGKTTYKAADCTGTAIGTGTTNTRLLVDAMGNEAYRDSYKSSNNSLKTADYAARLCDILTYTANGVTYDDWFLPSKDELDLMYLNLKRNGLGGFAYYEYWSSSEYDGSHGTDDYAGYAWKRYLDEEGIKNGFSRSSNFRVRPVRAF